VLDETLIEITQTNKQPLIIIIGDKEALQVDQMFIKCDHNKLFVPGKDIGFCLDYFFKLFWVFNIAYCPQLTNFMHFLEIIMKMPSDNKKPSINEFIKKVLN
jgi:hypothetical protein